jgi:hypothetical protein
MFAVIGMLHASRTNNGFFARLADEKNRHHPEPLTQPINHE